ncbi:MAG: Peptide methionine sulfoxide reductase MsrA [Fimbriimonadaceae bacterium]|nr:Peptide methionine sulfoxide reductase MsrA [Fimbriimonadaceae bacterium]
MAYTIGSAMIKLTLGLGAALAAIAGCVAMNPSETVTQSSPAAAQNVPADAKTLVLGAGCFWCVEAIFEDLKGVHAVESGYAGGEPANPTYEQVCSGRTGHAEVIKIFYNEKEVSADDLLRIFFTTHDPTTLNRQGPDSGTQYRSVIFVESDEDRARAKRIIDEISAEKLYPNPIVTTIEPLKNYSTAEAYHQDYFKKFETATPEQMGRMNAGYCKAIIEPKIRKFREKYAAKLRKK